MPATADRSQALGAYFLDVGQGDCTFIIDGRGEGVLMDCRDAHVAQRFVQDHGVRRLHAVVVSHLDRDHILGMHPFLRWFLARPDHAVGAVYLGLDREQPELTKTAATLLNAVLGWESAKRLAVGAPHRDGQPKTVWQSGDARVDIVLPYYASQVRARLEGGEEPNPSSVVLRLVRGNTAILVGGDAPLGSWERLEPELLPARLIRAPHHGGRIDEGRVTWTEDTLYERVGAATVVVSVGTHNGHEHPTDDHLRAIRVDRRRLLCTQLTPRCHADPAALRPGLRTRLAGGVLPYRHLHPSRQEVPCAGSVVAWLEPGDALEVEPAPGGPHDAFVAAVDHPRCRAT